MPELPDVEHFRRFHSRHAAGKTISRVVVTDPGILRGVTATTFEKTLLGHRFEEPDRHGKWLIAWTSGPTLLIHFGMTGDLSWSEGSTGRHRHDRVIFVLEDGELRYRNMRKLGGVWLAGGPDDVTTMLAALGPDALGVKRRQFHELLRRRRGRLKAALMDQRLVAGLGNILVDEILWHARLHPSTSIERVSESGRDLLYTKMRDVLRRSVEESDFPERKRRSLSQVRGLPGAACPRCGTLLGRTVIVGRTTYFCPRCQPLVD